MRRACTILATRVLNLVYTMYSSSTCAVPVSALFTNVQLPSFGGDLLPERTAFVQVQSKFRYSTVDQRSARALT
jgi:hypothetical protein